MCFWDGGRFEAIGLWAYVRRIEPLLQEYKRHYVHVGTLNPNEMAAFFRACHVTALPSINSTETFGLVQIEAALCGTPSVASDLPGVRIPTQITGMGRTVPPRDARLLAEAVCEVLEQRERFVRPRAAIAAQFSPAATAERYEALFESLQRHSAR